MVNALNQCEILTVDRKHHRLQNDTSQNDLHFELSKCFWQEGYSQGKAE
jgi:hypothetical protein